MRGWTGGKASPPSHPLLPSGAARAKFSSFPLPPFSPSLSLLPPPLLPPPFPSSPPPSYPVRPLIDVQADWRRSLTYMYDLAPNPIDISQGSLTCLSKHRHGANLFTRLFWETAPFQSPFTTRIGIRRAYSRHTTQGSHGGLRINIDIITLVCITFWILVIK